MSEQRLTVPDARQGPVEITAPTSRGEIFQAIMLAAKSDPANAKELYALYERMDAKEAEREFLRAFDELQPELPRVKKNGAIAFTDKSGKEVSTPFAKYEDVDAAVRPLMHKHGFSIGYGTAALEKGGILITATLAHRGGHSKTESMPLPFDTSGSKNSIQAVGSTLSYGKRYLLCAMLNIVTEGQDQDGQLVGFITDDQLNTIMNLVSACELTPERESAFLSKVAKAERFSGIQQKQYAACVTALQKEHRKLREAT